MLRASMLYKATTNLPRNRPIFGTHRILDTAYSYSNAPVLNAPVEGIQNKKGSNPNITKDNSRRLDFAVKSAFKEIKTLNNNNQLNENERGNAQQGTRKKTNSNPWSQLKKGDSKAERRIADALRGTHNRNNPTKRRIPKNNPPKGNQIHRNPGGSSGGGGIDKLREAFLKSLSVDRERRQANVKEQQANMNSNNQDRYTTRTRGGASFNSNSESRLDQLLRMSKQKPQRRGQSFRDRRLQDNNSNNRNNYQQQQQSREPSEAQLLQKQLMQESSMSQDSTADIDVKIETEVVLPHRDLSVLELSSILRVRKSKIAGALRDLGEKPPRKIGLGGFKIDTDMTELVALELGLDPKRETRGKCSMEAAENRMRRQTQEGIDTIQDNLYETYPTRPPVVCIMGHVDHGKTTLMDRLRQKATEARIGTGSKRKGKKSKKKKGKGGQNSNDGYDNVAGTEAGGITQVVSAFQVQLPGTDDGDSEIDVGAVTFLDTPGHAAFKAMRQSGSNGADVIVLVVAADDGVSNQTVEIIEMYKSIARAQPGSISLVVALTKIDKPGIDIDESIMRIENQLMEHDIFSASMSNSDSEFGGVEIVPVSGITGEGLDDLIEGLVLHSEIMDLRACQDSRAEGLIIDAKIENGLGVVADCIVRWGTLEVGDYVVSDVHGGKVRILNDVRNKSIKKAVPSQPVRIVGLKSLPKAGDPIVCMKSEDIAKELITRRKALASANDENDSFRAEGSNTKLDVIITGGASKKGFMADNVLRRYGMDSKSTSEEKDEGNDPDDQIRIPVILKADADGTLAALRDTLLAIKDESKLNLCIDPVEIGIGHVTASDINLATESGAAIFCFNLKGSKNKEAMSLASANNVEIRSNAVIYRLLDEAKDVFSKYCPATEVEKVHGEGKVQAVFDINNSKDTERVAGLMVMDGKLHLDKFKSDSGLLDCEYRIKRKKTIIATGLKAKSLRRVKEEVTDVRRGEECGLNLADHVDVEEGDVIECYSIDMMRRFV